MMIGPLLRRAFVVGVTSFTVGVPTTAAAQDRTLEIDDLRMEVGVSELVASPSGPHVVVTTSTANYEDNRFDRTLVLVDIATGDRRDLTPHRPEVSQPRWSPTGTWLGFIDSDEDDEDLLAQYKYDQNFKEDEVDTQFDKGASGGAKKKTAGVKVGKKRVKIDDLLTEKDKENYAQEVLRKLKQR